MSEVGDGPGGRGQLVAFVVLAVVVAAVAAFLALSHNKDEAPFSPVQAKAHLVGLRVLTSTDATGSNVSGALRSLGGSPENNLDLPGTGQRSQYLVGRVDVANLSAPDSEYELIVVDDRLHRVVAKTYSYPDLPTVKGVGQGWDGAAGSLHHQYDWQPSGQDQAAYFTPGTTTSLPFYAHLPPDSLPVTKVGSDLTVILALTRGSDHVYWSVKLS